MQDEAGGFYSAQDADSEGEEGKFYVWTPEEVEALLGKEEAQVFGDYFDVSSGGNFEGEKHTPPPARAEVLLGFSRHISGRLEAAAGRRSAKALRATRDTIRPGLDDKVLAAWNGMMLTALPMRLLS